MVMVLVFGAMPVSAQDVDIGLDTGEYVLNIWQIVGGTIAAVTAGGLMGIGGAGVLAARLRRDEATMTAIEKLADSAPRYVTDQINELTRSFRDSVREVAALIIEATDRVPAKDKPSEAPPDDNVLAVGQVVE